jgi:hypothetical protein
MSMQKSFRDFLKYTPSRKEVSLVIAKDKTELRDLVKKLEKDDFRQAADVLDLFKHIVKPSSKVFFVTEESLPKDMYDFMIQYPTGQVEVYDKFNLKSKLVVPVYDKVSVIFVVTKKSLGKSQESGYRILEQVGITYQG